MWSVALESRTQGLKKLEWVILARDIPICVVFATEVVKPEFWRSPYHLRNSIKIAGWPKVSNKIGSTI